MAKIIFIQEIMTLVGQEGDKATDFVNIVETLKEMTKIHANLPTNGSLYLPTSW